jgi:hypothetical protein
MPEAGWSEWLARLARNVNVLGQNAGAISGGGTGGSTVTTDDTPPTSPADGDMWWDSVGGQLYVWYDDPSGDPGQWVAATNQPGPPGPPGPAGGGAGGTVGEAPLDGITYGRQSAAWTHVLMATGDIVDGGNF